MGNPYPVEITDVQGEARLTGFADFTDPGNQPGGGSVPVQAVYSGNPVTIADGSGSGLPYTTLVDGVDLLDRTVPDQPVFLADGFYSVLATVEASAPLTAGGFAQVEINGPDANASYQCSFPDATAFGNGASFPQLCKFAAGDRATVAINNHDGAASHDFTLVTCVIVKLG